MFFQSHLLVICSGIVLTGFLGHELVNSTMHGGFLQQNAAQNILLITLMENNCPILLQNDKIGGSKHVCDVGNGHVKWKVPI